MWAAQFLEHLVGTGSVAMAARLVGKSRSAVYMLAGRSPTFKQAIYEARLEFQDLLLGEAHRRAIQGQSDSVLRALLAMYYPRPAAGSSEAAARIDPEEIIDEEISQVTRKQRDDMDLSQLTDQELSDLDALLDRASGSPAGEG